MRTEDGFEFEIVREPHQIACTCTKDGRPVILTWTPPTGKTTDVLPHTEHIERQARNLWIAAHECRERGLLDEES